MYVSLLCVPCPIFFLIKVIQLNNSLHVEQIPESLQEKEDKLQGMSYLFELS